MKVPGIKLVGAVAFASMLGACAPHPHHPHDAPPPPPHDCDAMRSPMERDWDAPPPPPPPPHYRGAWDQPAPPPPHHPCHHGHHHHPRPPERPAPGITKQHNVDPLPPLNWDHPQPPVHYPWQMHHHPEE